MVRSNVRGPNSALTEFLRSRGISIPNARLQRRNTASSTPTTPGLEDPLTPNEETADSAATEQENLDAAVAEELAAALERPAAASSSRRKVATKKRKKGAEDDAYDPADEPDYGRSGFSRKERPAAGQIDFCAECNCRFTVTIYNKATDAGLLCSACGSAQGIDKPAATARVRAKPTTKKKRAKAVLDGEMDKIPKLQDMAIRCIARHIQDVEALGDIGHVNMDKICQIISRNRSLTDDTIQLFLDASLTSLALYDCAKLSPQRLKQVAQMCPHLSQLRLHMCGQIDNSVVDFYGTHLVNLKSLTLRGCFLITTATWIRLFQNVGPRLEALEISDSSRFDAECAKALVQNCPNLKQLTLAKLTHLGRSCLAHLAQLTHLTKLEITYTTAAEDELVLDEHAIALLAASGNSLEILNFSGLRELTDATLTDGILKYCTKLQHLSLNELDLITDAGVAEFFSAWTSNPPLQSLEVERCSKIMDAGIDAILKHSGSSLRRLNLNSLDATTHEGILRIAQIGALPFCESLDLSWIRSMDDLVLRRLLENAKSLKMLWVWGNNRITECETSSRCLIIGRETG